MPVTYSSVRLATHGQNFLVEKLILQDQNPAQEAIRPSSLTFRSTSVQCTGVAFNRLTAQRKDQIRGCDWVPRPYATKPTLIAVKAPGGQQALTVSANAWFYEQTRREFILDGAR